MKNSKKLFSILSVSFLFIVTGTLVWAAGAMMKGVPQEVGIADVPFTELNQQFCRDCHGESLANTHHETKQAVEANCTHCHMVSVKDDKSAIALERDCLKCHKDSPHHTTEAAKNKECGECHEEGVSEYSTKVPEYEASMITPTSKSCNNCHNDATVGGKKVFKAKTTHHKAGIKGCNVCHEENKKSGNVRTCERCHNVELIHQIKGHVVKNACKGCHQMAKAEEPKKSKSKKKKKKKK